MVMDGGKTETSNKGKKTKPRCANGAIAPRMEHGASRFPMSSQRARKRPRRVIRLEQSVASHDLLRFLSSSRRGGACRAPRNERGRGAPAWWWHGTVGTARCDRVAAYCSHTIAPAVWNGVASSRRRSGRRKNAVEATVGREAVSEEVWTRERDQWRRGEIPDMRRSRFSPRGVDRVGPKFPHTSPK